MYPEALFSPVVMAQASSSTGLVAVTGRNTDYPMSNRYPP